ncbi:MAG: hypothetical protein M1834_008131 [Cirrosporium novae-zelandiae]|nr:MAG: hypothetical protein M1834_008131 [Cirrosporium novae-zelandiae]
MTSLLERALSLIDAAHSLDPNIITLSSGSTVPYELHYAQRMTSYLNRLLQSSSNLLCLAVRAQHFRRWEVPRDTYPRTKVGYLAWREGLKKRQAELVKAICLDSGYSAGDAGRVGALIRKEGLKEGDEEV